jgi:hypothetical protein
MLVLILLQTITTLGDKVIEKGSGVSEVACPELFCEYCGSSSAFLVTSSTFLVPGFLESSSLLLRSQVSELSAYLNGTTTVSISEKWLCIYVSDFESIPELPYLYNSLLSTSLEEKHHFIESFTISPNQTFQSKSQRTGSGVSWEEIQFLYKDIKSSLEEVKIFQITESVNRSSQYASYEGKISSIGGGEFIHQERYSRDYYDPFSLNVTCEAVLLSDIETDNDCQSFKTPRGISSVHYLAPQTGLFSYAFNGEKYLLEQTEHLAWCPEFSPGEGLIFARGSAYLKTSENQCFMDIRGTTTEKEPVQIVLEENDFIVFLNVGDKNITQLEKRVSSFFSDFISIVPKYLKNSASLNRVLQVTAVETMLVITFDPEAQINITAIGKVVSLNDSQIWAHIERIDSVVQSVLKINDLEEPGMSFILGVGSEEGDIVSSTGRFELDGEDYYPGVFFTTQDLQGTLFPDDFFLSQEVDNIELTNEITAENVNRIQYIEPFQSEYFTGDESFILGGNILDFKLTLHRLDSNDSYFVNSSMTEVWKAPFDVSTLQVPLFWIDFETKDHFMVYFENKGLAVFYCNQSSDDCWYGQARVDYPESLLDQYNYSELLTIPESKSHLYLFLSMNPVQSSTLFEVLFKIDATRITSSFEFIDLVDITINSDHYLFSSQALCFGVFCNISGNFRSEHPYLEANLSKLELAHGNLIISPSNSTLSLQLEVSPGGLFGSLSGKTEIWKVLSMNPYDVNENNADTSFFGFIFEGIFNLTMDLTILIQPELEKAPVYLLGYLQEDDLQNLTELVLEELNSWISKAEYVLGMSQEIAEDYLYQTPLPECLCEKDVICYSDENRTLPVFKYSMNCTSETEGCEPIELYCTRDTSYCLQQEVKCTEWYKNIPNTCKTTTTSCVKHVDICLDWVEVCHDHQLSGCSQITIQSIENYQSEDYSCESLTINNFQCESQCLHQQNVENYRTSLTDEVVKANQQIIEKLEGFSYLSENSLFHLLEVKLDKDLDSSGIGPNDIHLLIKAEIFSIELNDLKTVSTELPWDFFNISSDVKSLYDWARSVIIDESSGTLDEELKDRSALEIYYESYQ